MYLNRIIATKRDEVKQLKERITLQDLESIISTQSPTRGFEKALRGPNRTAMGLIAEVKKASPSKGLIRADFNPVHIAQAYELAGADCLSVLTDEQYFQGSNTYLQQVKEAVKLPLLRKDFTIDELQIYEARAIGADAILLIAAILTTDQLHQYIRKARELQLDVLVEVHNQFELERVLELDVTLIGINNRNLKTFITDLSTTEQLISMIPTGVIRVSESGITLPEEINYLSSVGADAVLVGEHFMRQPDIGLAVNELLGAAAQLKKERGKS
ncbi:MAG: indole-3-glycerol phosphate synthase TrpC [Paenibacillaceae bacterium]